MLAAADRTPRTGIQHHRAKVVIGASAELAGEVAADPAFVRFVATSVRIVRTRIQHERAEVVVLHPAMNAVERPFLVTLEERVFAAPVRMMGTRIQEQRPRVVVLLPAVSAKFAHRTPHFKNVITRLTIISFSSGRDSAIITVSATSVWSAMRFEPSLRNMSLLRERK